MMDVRINAIRFELDDPEAPSFFTAHGFVVLKGVLSEDELRAVDASWEDVVDAGASSNAMERDEFVRRYPQNRDLWRKHPGFHKLLFGSRQSMLAASLLGTSGVRLFHDHAIAKPVRASGTIPWHQDSAYWPLDRVGLSIWTPTSAVSADGGCIEVLDGSHHDGPGVPQDFLAQGTSEMLADDPRLTLIPVARGESVVLSGLTWHRSRPNVASGRRLAYLTLWVPATARFRPEHASWHPSASHVEVDPGERLAGEWFPLFGDIADEDEGESVSFPSPQHGDGPSMFTASKDIRNQIRWLLGGPGTSGRAASIEEAETRGQIADECIRRGFVGAGERSALLEVLAELQRSDEVRRRSVARDVYLQAPLRWWSLVGGQIASEMARGRA